MSIANLLTSQNPNDQSYLNITVNDLLVDGTLTSSGAIVTSGNITVSNTNPSISIVQNSSSSTNNASLILSGKPGLGNVVLQQQNNGNANLVNFNPNSSVSIDTNGSGQINLSTGSANINLVPQGSGHVTISGPAYPAGPYPLQLNGSNQIDQGGVQTIFVPTLLIGGTSVGVPQTSSGRYSQYGKLIYFSIQIQVGDISGVADGNATISGLPFQSSLTQPVSSISICNFSGLVFTGIPCGSINSGVQTITLNQADSGNPQAPLKKAAFPLNAQMNLSGFYFTS